MPPPPPPSPKGNPVIVGGVYGGEVGEVVVLWCGGEWGRWSCCGVGGSGGGGHVVVWGGGGGGGGEEVGVLW